MAAPPRAARSSCVWGEPCRFQSGAAISCVLRLCMCFCEFMRAARPPGPSMRRSAQGASSVKLALCVRGEMPGPSAATGPTGRSGERLVGLTEKIYPNRDSDSDSRRPPRARTCVVCEGESISNGSTHLGRVRGRVLALARPIGPQQLDGPAGRIDASSKGWMGLVKLLPRLVVKRPRPRDTLNDDDEFTTPSPRTFALRPAAAARADLRRVARVSYQVWRTHMRACVAEYNFRGRVGRVRTGAPSRDDPARKKKVHVFVPWIPSDRFFLCFLAAFSRRFSSS